MISNETEAVMLLQEFVQSFKSFATDFRRTLLILEERSVRNGDIEKSFSDDLWDTIGE